jgi:hypothetical protein
MLHTANICAILNLALLAWVNIIFGMAGLREAALYLTAKKKMPRKASMFNVQFSPL